MRNENDDQIRTAESQKCKIDAQSVLHQKANKQGIHDIMELGYEQTKQQKILFKLFISGIHNFSTLIQVPDIS